MFFQAFSSLFDVFQQTVGILKDSFILILYDLLTLGIQMTYALENQN